MHNGAMFTIGYSDTLETKTLELLGGKKLENELEKWGKPPLKIKWANYFYISTNRYGFGPIPTSSLCSSLSQK